MKCDELKAYGMADPAIDDEYEMYKVAEVDEAIAELNAENESLKAKLDKKDAEIASLKAQIAEAKELSILLQKRNKDIADNAIGNVEAYKTKCDAEIESLKASHYAEMVDAGMRERRLRRALWLVRAMRGRDNSILLPSRYMRKVWDNVESKCRAMADKWR